MVRSNLYKKIYWWIGNFYRFLTIPFFQRKIFINDISTIFGSSFDKENGWNHIIETLKEYDLNPDISYKETTMYFYLKYFTPKSILDLIDNTGSSLSIFVYPWGTFKKGELFSNKDANFSRFCGPSSDAFIEEEFNRVILLYHKLKKDGYRPWINYNRHIGGTFLIDKNNKKRFVVLQGNHRVAIFSHLGYYKKISVRNVKGFHQRIFEENFLNWMLVKNNECNQQDAINVFKLFFRENGHHILDHIKKNKQKIN
tara:strand:+ start:5116 stop:5880 length:765 start_codon:yes stop_codon:yes gene_type:complete